MATCTDCGAILDGSQAICEYKGKSYCEPCGDPLSTTRVLRFDNPEFETCYSNYHGGIHDLAINTARIHNCKVARHGQDTYIYYDDSSCKVIAHGYHRQAVCMRVDGHFRTAIMPKGTDGHCHIIGYSGVWKLKGLLVGGKRVYVNANSDDAGKEAVEV